MERQLRKSLKGKFLSQLYKFKETIEGKFWDPFVIPRDF